MFVLDTIDIHLKSRIVINKTWKLFYTQLYFRYKIAMETEQVGQDILNNLAQDKEKIQRSRGEYGTWHSKSMLLLNQISK